MEKHDRGEKYGGVEKHDRGEKYGGGEKHDRGDDQRSRQLNERHKSLSHANHNRKNLADRKRNKGMGALSRF